MTERAWCDTCRRMRDVAETYTSDSGDRFATVREVHVTNLECGHQSQHETREYPSPLQQDADLPRAYDIPSPWE